MAGRVTPKDLIKYYRTEVSKQTQAEFGKQFDVTHAAVSGWESGKSNIPNEVVEVVLDKVGMPEIFWITCPRCAGVGKVSKWAEWQVVKQANKFSEPINNNSEQGQPTEWDVAHREGYARALYHAGVLPYREAFRRAIKFEAKEAIDGLAKK